MGDNKSTGNKRKKMNINHISVSRKKCFDLCAQQYKYRYHLKVPAPGPEPFYFVYGKIVHSISEMYLDEKGAKTIWEIATSVMKGDLPFDGEKKFPVLPQEYKNKIQGHLKAVETLTKKTGFDGVTEHEFKFDLDPPNDKCAYGFIDRLIIKGEGTNKKAFIIDYKTTKKGKYRVNEKTVLHDLQLRCYARVVQRDFGVEAKNIKAALYYLEGENLISAQYSDESLQNVEKDLRDSFIKIEKTDPDKVWGNVGWHCKNCDYSTICTFYRKEDKIDSSWCGDLSKLGHPDSWN
jgi:CRISPR/Cas system-associated exonuclease Cas4 (RecB family)